MSNVVDLTNDSYQKANENTIMTTKTINYTNQIADVFNLNINNANMMNTNNNVNNNGYSANGLSIFNTNGINNYSTYNNGQNYNIGYDRAGYSASSSSSSAAAPSSSSAAYYLHPTTLQPTTQYLYKANAIISFILLNAREFSAIADNGVIPPPTLSTLSMIPGARFDFAR